MCLSTVYNEKEEVLAKNISSVTVGDRKLVFTDIMGVSTTICGAIEAIDLEENVIHVKTA